MQRDGTRSPTLQLGHEQMCIGLELALAHSDFYSGRHIKALHDSSTTTKSKDDRLFSRHLLQLSHRNEHGAGQQELQVK